MAFTFFFRDKHTLELIANKMYESSKSNHQINIWDAGCAMGPEPYTLAIILKEKFLGDYHKINIDATDIDESGHFGEIITKGIYPYSDLSRMPENILDKYFQKYSEHEYLINKEIKESVKYGWHDLLSLKSYGRNYNLILCKNVLLHFQPQERIEVIKMFHSSLISGGLFSTEQTQKIPDECTHLFEKITSDANIYKKI